jgi:hypothetical protein
LTMQGCAGGDENKESADDKTLGTNQISLRANDECTTARRNCLLRRIRASMKIQSL